MCVNECLINLIMGISTRYSISSRTIKEGDPSLSAVAGDLQGQKTMGIFAKPPPTELKAKYMEKGTVRHTSFLRLASPNSQSPQIRQTRLVFICRAEKRRGGSVVKCSTVTAPTHTNSSRHRVGASADRVHHARTRSIR